MMVTIGICLRRLQRLLRRWMADPKIHTLLQASAYFSGGFALSAASLSNQPQPFVLGALCACSGWPAILLSLGAMAGYPIFWGAAGIQPLIWTMGATVAVIVLGGKDILREIKLMMPALAALIVAVTGTVFRFWLEDDTHVAMYLLRIGLAGVSVWLFTLAAQRRDPLVDWTVCGIGVLALAQIAPFPWLNLGCIAAGILCCVGAFPAAALAGLALDLSRITPVPMTAVLSLAYLCRLLPFGKRWLPYGAPAAVYLAVMALCGFWDFNPVAGLLLGGAAAVLLPGHPGIAPRRGETGGALVRLERASGVLDQTRELLHCVEEMPIDEQALISRAADRACSSCPCRKTCREKPENMSVSLLHKPLGNGGDLPSGCRKSGRLLQELRRSQEQLRSIRADRDRQREYRAAVVQQYGFLSDYLQDLSDQLARRTEPAKQWYDPEIFVCSNRPEEENGDKCIWFAGVECRYYVLLCDGMGAGPEAAREAQAATALLQKMLSAGYPAEYSLRSVNSICALQGRAGAVTIDLAELHLDTGKAVVYKWGAAASFVISRGEPIKIGTAAPPPGLSVAEGRETAEKLSLRRGETLVVLSDGAGGEEPLRRAWERCGTDAEALAAEILDARGEADPDDATVAVVRLVQRSLST